MSQRDAILILNNAIACLKNRSYWGGWCDESDREAVHSLLDAARRTAGVQVLLVGDVHQDRMRASNGL